MTSIANLTRLGTIGYFYGFAHQATIRMKASSARSPASFEAALQELESIVQTLEGGGTPLEDALKAYERGMSLLNYCQETLGQAEQKIRFLDNGTLRDLPAPAREGDSS
jgi:exodeoxyribonuclease VII small subunit